MKKCSKCGEVKSLTEYHRHAGRSDGLANKCKSCVAVSSKNYRENNSDKIKISRKLHYSLNKDKILEKQREYQKENRESLYAKHKEYYCKNAEEVKRRQRELHKINKEDRDLNRRIYIEKNKDSIRKSERDRRRNDPEFKLKSNISRLFRHKLSIESIQKTDSTFYYTGIQISEYIEHLKNDPLWEDYESGSQELHLDHVIAVSLFDHSDLDEIKKCWNPRNLRLLPAIENKSKNDKFIPELVEKYRIHDLLPNKLKSI